VAVLLLTSPVNDTLDGLLLPCDSAKSADGVSHEKTSAPARNRSRSRRDQP
jgi:hypothetical protein